MAPNEAIKNQKHACVRCRRSKIRCLVDTVKEHGKCRRCYDGDDECIFELMAPRPQRQRTDTRLSILEKQLQALKAAFESTHSSQKIPGSIGSSRTQDARRGSASARPAESSSLSSDAHTEHLVGQESLASGPDSEIYDTVPGYISSDVLALSTAGELLADFVLYALPEYPVLVPADGDSFQSLRQDKPILLFAMLTAASRAKNPTLFDNLHSRLLRLLTDKVVINGERSLELLQAVLITEVWYNPPDDLRRLNFYLWIQIAGTMALQLGLWWDPHMLAAVMNDEIHDEIHDVSSRRPLMINMNHAARSALAKFTTIAVHLNDKRLAAWVGLQVIAEDVEDLRLQTRSMLESRIALSAAHASALQELEERLDLFERTSAGLMSFSLQVHYLWTWSKLNELIVFHHHMSIATQEDTPNGQQGPQFVPGQATLSARPGYLQAVMRLIRTCHSILDQVIGSDQLTYLNAPTITTVRALYAMKELLFLREASIQELHPAYGLIDVQVLSLDFYLDSLGKYLAHAKGAQGHKIPKMALSTIHRIRNRLILSNRQLIKRTPASGNLQVSPESAESAGDSDNDLEGVTTPNLPDLRGQDQTPLEHLPATSATAQFPASLPGVGSTTRPFHPGFGAYNQQATDAVSGTSQFNMVEFDLMSMPDGMPLSDPLLWDSMGDPLSYGWHGGPGELLPVDWP